MLTRKNSLLKSCRQAKASYFKSFLKYLYFRLQKKNIYVSNNVLIYGVRNIHTFGTLKIGLNYVGFMNRYDRTFLNVQGDMNIFGFVTVSKGCRFDVGKGAVVSLDNTYINPNTTFIIMHGITIGSGTVISWNCQFLDDDFHRIYYKEKHAITKHNINIGSNVWIGSNVSILKGVSIPEGCVIASGAVVFSSFEVKNALIAGNPARIVRKEIYWE